MSKRPSTEEDDDSQEPKFRLIDGRDNPPEYYAGRRIVNAVYTPNPDRIQRPSKFAGRSLPEGATFLKLATTDDPSVLELIAEQDPPSSAIQIGGALQSTNIQDSYTVDKVRSAHHKKFNATETSYSIKVRPTPGQVATLDSYMQTLHALIDDVTNRVAADAHPDDYIQFVVAPKGLPRAIGTPFVKKKDFSSNIVTSAVSNVTQSDDSFIQNDEFELHTKVIRQPQGGARGIRGTTAAIASLKKRSILQIRTPNGLCLPASIIVGKARLDHGVNGRPYQQLRFTDRLLCARESTAFARAALQRQDVSNCTYNDLELFQNHLGPTYQIKVVVWAPRREVAWIGRNCNPDAKIIALCYDSGSRHFDLITKLPGFFDQHEFCHECNKAYCDARRHKCISKCYACYRPHCPNKNDKLKFYCDKCMRTFPGRQCFVDHFQKSARSTMSLCDRLGRCSDCGRMIKKQARSNPHVCGEVFCNNCTDFFDPDHKCYIKPLVQNEDHGIPTGGNGEDDAFDQNEADANDLDNILIRDREQEDGDFVVVASPEDIQKFDSQRYIYFDVECYADEQTGEHICDLIVAEPGENGVGQMVFAGDNCVSEFCEWAITEQHKDCTFISHNGKKYDNYFVVNWLVTHTNLQPKIILNGASAMLVKLNTYNIRFIDSVCFMACPLASLPKMFGLENELAKGFFPHKFHSRNTLNYVGPLPAAELYDPGHMSAERREEFQAWYNEQIVAGTVFDLQKDMTMYCRADVKVLKDCCSEFRKLFFQETTVDPFQYVTIASACNAVFRKNFLKPNTIGIIPPQGYIGNDRQSYRALLWLSWVERQRNEPIQHKRSGGEHTLITSEGCKLKLDGALVAQKIAFEFLGCYWHGCTACYTGRTFNTRLQAPMSELHRRWEVRQAQLFKEGWTCHYVWECDFMRQLKEDQGLADFAKDEFALSEPLNPRDGFYGGRTNAGALYYRVTKQGEKILYYDINSLYPYINKSRLYPIGHPEILLGCNVDIANFDRYLGLCKCTILPPRHQYHPVLPYRVGGKLMFPLCRTCVEEQCHHEVCNHTPEERSLSATWVTEEIKLAVNHGYEILAVDELWHFEDYSGSLFNGYINTFLKLKQQSRGYGESVTTEEEKDQYIDTFHQIEGVLMDKDKIDKNPGLYQVSKICLNSFWGKFGQRCGLPNVELVENEFDLWRILSSERYEVMQIHFPSEEMVQVQYRESAEFLLPGLTTNVVIAAFTTAYARMLLWESLNELGDRALYWDTDSIIFAEHHPGMTRPPTGDHLGVFKDEVGSKDTIIEYTGAGPKFYGYRTEKGKVVLKVRGFTLNHVAAQVLNYDSVRSMVLDHDWVTEFSVDMGTSIARDINTWAVRTTTNRKSYRFGYDKRKICPNLTTVPWGYIGPLSRITDKSLM